MKIWKILTAITLLFLILGIVAATDIDNLKVPEDWESVGGGTYHQTDIGGGGNGQNMLIQKWYDGLKDEYYQNISDEEYFVIDKENNTFMYTDGYNEDSGSFEVVQIDGEKYFVNFWTVDDLDAGEVAKTYQFMMEFNKLNNLEPIAV